MPRPLLLLRHLTSRTSVHVSRRKVSNAVRLKLRKRYYYCKTTQTLFKRVDHVWLVDTVIDLGRRSATELFRPNLGQFIAMSGAGVIMASPGYFGDGPPMRESDPYFTEVISQKMRVPERLRFGPAPHAHEPADQRREGPPAAYSMHIPDRLALTDVPDLSPRPFFSKHTSMWDLQHGSADREPYMREPVQSPLRRSYSDQAFGRTPPGTPTYSKQALRSQTPRSVGHPPAVHADPSPPKSPGLPSIPPNLLSPHSVLQAAKELGQQASQKLLQTVTKKYSSRFGYPESRPSQAVEVQPDQSRTSASQEYWISPEEDAGTAVEFMVLRRQVVKMSRRIAGLERQNAEHRQTELVLFSLLMSACLINGWLWLRR